MSKVPDIRIRGASRASIPAGYVIGRVRGKGPPQLLNVQALRRLSGGAAIGLPPGIRELTGDVIAGPGSGVQPAALSTTGVVAGTYTIATITVDAKGRVTSASSGSAGGVSSFNTRTGAVTLTSGDVTTALGFTPLDVAASSFAGSAAKLTTARSLSITGDVTWTVSFDGSAAVTAAGTLANTAVTPGSYTSADITVDAKGRITAAANGSGGGGTPGGSANQIQYNAAGSFGGFTMSGDATIVVATGVITVANSAITTAKINGQAVTLAKIANASANSVLLGAGSAGSGASYAELALGTGLSMSGTTLSVSGSPAALVYQDASVPGGNTVANTVTETAFSSTNTFSANQLQVGSVIRVKMAGVYSTALVAPNLTGKVKLGGTTILNTGALTTVAGVTNAGWTAEGTFIVTAIGSSGTVEAQGFAQFATAATTGLSANITNTAAITINTTTSLALTTTVQWSSASASNTITLREQTVTLENSGTIPGLPSSLTNHGVVLGQGTAAVVATTAGTSGQVLTSNGASADPTFQTIQAGNITLISRVTTSGSQASVTFSTIAGTYKDLIVRVLGRANTASVDNDTVLIQLNGDTAANYAWSRSGSSEGSAFQSGAHAQTAMTVGFLPAATSTAGYPGWLEVQFPQYAGTTWKKNGFSTALGMGSANNIYQMVLGVAWNSTAAITAILVKPSGANTFVNGSIVELLGVSY